jgi:cytochrome P450
MSGPIADIPVSELDPYARSFMDEPYAALATLRNLGPVVRLSRYDCWVVTRYAECNAVLLDWETFTSAGGVGLADVRTEKAWRAPSIILEVDPPLHTRTHRVLARVMTPARLRALRPVFEAEAAHLVDALVAAEGVDGIGDIARAFPLKVFPDAVGLPVDGRENLLPYGDLVFNAVGPRNALLEGAMACGAPVMAWIMAACSRAALASNGIGAQVYAAVDTGELGEEEAGMLVRSLLSAGLDTTIAAIGNTLYAFSRAPDQWRRLRENPGLARAAFDEAMRLESPVQAFFRTATRDAELAGVRIAAGDKVLVYFSSANRDPARWDDPEAFDITRRSGGHVAFGAGIHRCVGEMLAELEGEILLTALARRVRTIAPTAAPTLHYNNSMRSFARLPLSLVP